MAGFSESSTVQAWLVERLIALGWEHVPGSEVPRERTSALAEEWLIESLEVLNAALYAAPERMDEVLRLTLLPPAESDTAPPDDTRALGGAHTESPSQLPVATEPGASVSSGPELLRVFVWCTHFWSRPQHKASGGGQGNRRGQQPGCGGDGVANSTSLHEPGQPAGWAGPLPLFGRSRVMG